MRKLQTSNEPKSPLSCSPVTEVASVDARPHHSQLQHPKGCRLAKRQEQPRMKGNPKKNWQQKWQGHARPKEESVQKMPFNTFHNWYAPEAEDCTVPRALRLPKVGVSISEGGRSSPLSKASLRQREWARDSASVDWKQACLIPCMILVWSCLQANGC